MVVKTLRDNCDGKGPQIVEVEVSELSSEELAARKAVQEARRVKNPQTGSSSSPSN